MKRIRDSIDPRRRRSSGQSMVEFVLVFPILMILLVAVADFGRIFAAGVVVEAAARDAAEIAAQQYISNPPGDLATAAPAPPPGYYSALHAKAVRAACIETKNLPNSQFDPATETCPGMPLTFVCVHDGADDQCATEAQGQTPPSGCSEMATSPTNAQGASAPKRWVEVRVCYRFNTILNIPITLFTEFFIQRQRSFTIACWLKTGSECG